MLAERPSHVAPDRVVDFDMYQPPEVERGFHEAWLALQEPGVPDLVWTPRNGGHWLATRGKLISRLFEDHEHFSNSTIVVPKANGEHHKMIPTTIDPPEHRPYRVLLNSSLSPKAVGGIEASIRAVAVELIEAVRAQGRCDFIADYAQIFPIRIFLSMADLPMADAPRLKYLADQVTRPDGSLSFEDTMNAIRGYFEAVIDQRMGAGGADIFSRMINGQVNGRALTRHEALQISAQILIAGLDTVVNFLGFVMLFLAENADQRRRLAADPSLIPMALEELFRRYPIVTIGREVRHDIELDGATLKAGEMVIMPSALHGLDDRENDDPLRIDFDRPAASHSTFGNGHHRCPGAHLARTELRITLEEWLARIPDFVLAGNADLRFSGGIVGCVDALPLTWSSD